MKKILLAIIVVLILMLIYWVVAVKLKKNPEQQPAVNQTQSEEKSTDPVFEYTQSDKLPAGFPSFIPIEKDAKITQNLSAVTPEGKNIAVREFVSAISMQKNYELYKKFLTDNGYLLENEISETEQKIVSGTKDGYRIRVRTYKTAEETLVTVNYVQM